MPESPKLPPHFPDVSSDAHVDPIVIPAPKKRSLWQKLGGTSLTVSVIFHGILVVIGLLWIYQIVTPPEKIVDFMPTSGGGGRPSAEAQTRQQFTRQNDASRITDGGDLEFHVGSPWKL